MFNGLLGKIKSEWGPVLYLAWPLIVSHSFWNVQLTVDRIFLGTYSTEALAAASAVTSIYWVPMALLQQTSAYVSTFIAQFFGAGQNEKIGSVFWQSIYIGFFGGIAFLGFIFITPQIFDFVGHEESVKIYEISYFKAICFTALPVALMASIGGFFTGLGRTKEVLLLNAVGVSFNILFDYMFIFGNFGAPKFGVAGAGYATALGSIMSVILGLCLIFKIKHEKDYNIFSGCRFDSKLMKRFLKFGFPSGFQWAVEGLAFTLFLIFVGRYSNGSVALAASSISFTIMMLSILPAMGVSKAAQILVGQHLGNKRPDLAEKATWSALQISTTYVALMAFSFIFVPEFYISWFNNSESVMWPQVALMVPSLLMFVAAVVCFDAVGVNFALVLKGAGDTKFVSLMALVLPWPIMVVPAYYLIGSGDSAVYWAWAGTSLFLVVQAIVFVSRFLGGKWKSMSVID